MYTQTPFKLIGLSNSFLSFLCYFAAKHDVSKITHFRGSVFLKFSVCAIFYALFILYPFARWFCSRQLSTTVGGSRARMGRRRRQSTTTERWEWSSWRRSPRRGTRSKRPLRSQDQLGGHLRRVGTVWDVSQLGAWALNQFVSIRWKSEQTHSLKVYHYIGYFPRRWSFCHSCFFWVWSVTALWLSTTTSTPNTQLTSNLSQFGLTFCGNFDIKRMTWKHKLFKVGVYIYLPWHMSYYCALVSCPTR